MDSARVSDFEILGGLGVGNFGSVHLARWGMTASESRAVALKKNTSKSNCCNEYAMLRKAAHKHVVEAFCLVESGRALAMEVAFSDLDSYLYSGLYSRFPCFDAGPVIAIELIQQWLADLAEGLAHVHSVGVIHRDVKPANILLFMHRTTAMAGGFVRIVAKLGDFNCARDVPKTFFPPSRLRTKTPCFDAGVAERKALGTRFPMTMRVCTSWYKAPELLRESDYPQRSSARETRVWYGVFVDVWSFGAVTYELLYGKPLASHDSIPGVLACLRAALGPPPCFDAGGAPEYMRTELWKCLLLASERATAAERKYLSVAQGSEWDVAKACLQWDPAQRLSMRHVARMPWLSNSGTSGNAEALPSFSPPQAVAASSSAAGPGEPMAPPPPLSPHGTPRSRLGDRVLRYTAVLRRPSKATSEPCACTGNCRTFQHRSEGECHSQELVEGTAYCILCVCKVPGCDRPKYRSEWCYYHVRALEAAPAGAQLAIITSHLSTSLLPCDVKDCLDWYGEVEEDIVMCILLAVIKEPRATRVCVEGWRRLPPNYGADDLYAVLVQAARACASTPGPSGEKPRAPHETELQQLSRQGVARFTGLATTLTFLNVVRKKKSSDGEEVSLGLHCLCYAFTEDTTTLQIFLKEVREQARTRELHRLCFDTRQGDGWQRMARVLKYGEEIRGMMRRVGSKVCMGTQGGDGYVVDMIIRKMSMACLEGMSWKEVSIRELRAVSADETEQLSAFSCDMKAEELSNFVCGRPDWAFLASCYMCLWKEVADKLPDARSVVSALCNKKPGFLEGAVQAFVAKHGIPPHPYVLLTSAGVIEVPPRIRRNKRKRAGASTPGASTPGSAKPVPVLRRPAACPSAVSREVRRPAAAVRKTWLASSYMCHTCTLPLRNSRHVLSQAHARALCIYHASAIRLPCCFHVCLLMRLGLTLRLPYFCIVPATLP